MVDAAVRAVSVEDESVRERADDASGGAADKIEDLALSLSQRAEIPRWAVIGSFLLLLFGSIYFARDFLLPIILALLFALTLSPVVRFLARRRIPPAASAFAILLAIVFSLAAGVYLGSGSVNSWVASAPEMGARIKERVAELRKPVDAVVKASEQVDEVTDADNDDPEVVQVAIKQPGFFDDALSNVGSIVATVGVTLILIFFLLASGDLFYEKAIRAVPTFSDKKRVLRIIYDIEREVSGYLFTVFLINSALGAVVAAGMYLLDMPNFFVWGLAAALLNFVPYIGAIVGVALSAAVSFISFDTLSQAVLPPIFYLVATMLEGQLITPLLLGRRLELNSVAIFISVALWTWLWGFVGALIAVPLLVMTKVFCDHVEGLNAFGQFLSARRPIETEDG